MIACKIVALDLSINSSGCVKFYLDWSNYSIISVDYLGFNQVKKKSNDKIKHFKKTDFRTDYDQFFWMQQEIKFFCKDADYIACEGYSFGSRVGLAFNIAEFGFCIKGELYKEGHKLRIYSPNTIKMFASGSGAANKVGMDKAYREYPNKLEQIELGFLPEYDSPRADIVDAWWIGKLLQTELQLRCGNVNLNELSEKQQQVFIGTKKKPNNLLEEPFLGSV